MRAFSNLPIKHKLTLISLLTSTAALLLACGSFIGYEQITFKKELVGDVSTAAEMIGYNIASALSFNDANSAEQTLKGLQAEPHIVAGCIYDKEGKVFATYARDQIRPVFGAAPGGNVERFGPDRLELFRPIKVAGEMAGTIYLQADLTEMGERFRRYGLISIGVMLIATLAAYVIAARLQRVISAPVSDLVSVASRVAADKDYSVRATKHGDDELGRLIDGFNEMLGQIQLRDGALENARHGLEQRVQERTRELSHERARLQLIFEAVPIGISLTRVSTDGAHARLINDAHLRICDITRTHADEPDIFVRLTHADDGRREELLTRQLIDGRIDRYSLEKRYCLADGQVRWVVFSNARNRHPDGSYEDLSTVVDITELKKAQEETARQQVRLKFIFDSVPVGLTWMVQNDLATRTVNPAHAKITGVPAEYCRNLELYRLATHPDDRTQQDSFHRRLTAGEIDHYDIEKRYVHADGSVRWTALTVHLHRDPTGAESQEISTLIDITGRKEAESRLKETHQQLLDASRQAGMAEVATGVLHNVGNVLNSVNVSATLVDDQVRHTKAVNVAKLATLFAQHKTNLADFITKNPRGLMIPAYLETLAESLAAEQATVTGELENLRKNIEHIKDIVAMQQTYARTSGVIETISVPDLIEDALRMNAGSLARHDVVTVRDYQARGTVTTDKHKIIQILINLVRNAKYACDESGRTDKRIVVRTTANDRGVQIAVTDNGVGIPPENLTRIFAHGFTTRKSGHGFGLHSGALAAKELGGALTVHSAGRGHGATFALEIPYKPEGAAS